MLHGDHPSYGGIFLICVGCSKRTSCACAVLREQAIVQHALRQTLVADALTLQLKLPPAGVPAPVSRSSPTVAGGAPVVDVLAVTSVWAVHILRSLSQVRA